MLLFTRKMNHLIAFIKAIGNEKLELPGEDGVLDLAKKSAKGRI